jgi:hypothetical protein
MLTILIITPSTLTANSTAEWATQKVPFRIPQFQLLEITADVDLRLYNGAHKNNKYDPFTNHLRESDFSFEHLKGIFHKETTKKSKTKHSMVSSQMYTIIEFSIIRKFRRFPKFTS